MVINPSVINPSVTSGLVFNSQTYIKYKIFQDFEQKVNDIFYQKLFPKFKTRVSYLALFIKPINGKKFHKWLESDFLYSYDRNLDGIHNSLMQKVEDKELKGSGFEFVQIKEAIIEIYKVRDLQASSWVELPEKYNKKYINFKYKK